MASRGSSFSLRFGGVLTAGFFGVQLLTAQFFWDPAPEPPQPVPQEKAAPETAGGAGPKGVLTGTVISGDGLVLAGATVTLTPAEGGTPRTIQTDGNGNFILNEVPFANMTSPYTLTVELEGFGTFSGSQVVPRPGVHRNITLFAAGPEGEIVIHSAFDAAGNRPPWLYNSGVAPGAALNIFGSFPVDQLTFNELGQDGSLDNEVAGIEVFIRQGGTDFEAETAWIAPNQAVSIVPQDLQEGGARVFMRMNGQASNAAGFSVHAKIFHFTWSANGQGTAAATHLDNTPVTFTHPAQANEIITTWNSAAPDSAFTNTVVNGTFGFGVSGQIRPEDQPFFFFGNSGRGFGQNNFAIDDLESDPYTCGSRIWMADPEDYRPAGNIVALPTSRDGGPCNDPYGFNDALIAALDDPGGLTVGGFAFNEASIITFFGSELNSVREQFEFRFNMRTNNELNYPASVPPGECALDYRPAGFQPAAGTVPTRTGALNVNLGGLATVSLDDTNNYAQNLTSVPGLNPLDGPINVDLDPQLVINGEPFEESWQASYQRSTDLLDATDALFERMLDDLPDGNWADLAFFFLDGFVSNPPETAAIGYGLTAFFDGGAFGSYTINCAGDAGYPLQGEALDREVERLGGVVHLGHGDDHGASLYGFRAEQIVLTLRFFQLDRNQQLRSDSGIATVDNFRREYRFNFFPPGGGSE